MKLRLACYNVHNFTNAHFGKTTSEIAEVLTNFDVVGLQEADFDIEEVKKCNKDFQAEFEMKQLGNALLFNLRPKAFVIWQKFYRYVTPYYPRGVLSTVFKYKNKKLHIYVTHLDHEDEDIRLVQLERLKEIIEKERDLLYTGRDFPHIVMGDFNSLTKSDYTPEEWNSIAEIRSNNDWESPRTEVMERMREWGYHDLLGNYCAQKGEKVPLTSRFDTRVDYILSSQPLTVTGGGSINTKASDHLPIFVDILL